MGMRKAYLENEWDGFGSITEEVQVLTAIRNHEFKDFALYPHLARDKVYIDPRPRAGIKTGKYLHDDRGLFALGKRTWNKHEPSIRRDILAAYPVPGTEKQSGIQALSAYKVGISSFNAAKPG